MLVGPENFGTPVNEWLTRLRHHSSEHLGLVRARDQSGMKNCLVADPSEVVRRVISHLMAPHGFLTLEASSGKEALEAFRKEAPAMVFVDWKLPDIDALDVIRVMREDTAPDRTQIVFLTSVNDPAVWSKALASGADAQLIKPFTELELRGLLAFDLSAA